MIAGDEASRTMPAGAGCGTSSVNRNTNATTRAIIAQKMWRRLEIWFLQKSMSLPESIYTLTRNLVKIVAALADPLSGFMVAAEIAVYRSLQIARSYSTS